MTILLAVLYCVWAGACWVLRGGFYGRIYRWALGMPQGAQINITQQTRVVSSFLMVLPLAVAMPETYLLWLFLWGATWAAMTIGYFDESMGLEKPVRHHIWLAIWGVCVSFSMLLPSFLIGILYMFLSSYFFDVLLVAQHSIFWAGLGAIAMPIYAVNKLFGGHWTQRAEFGAGVAFGLSIYLTYAVSGTVP